MTDRKQLLFTVALVASLLLVGAMVFTPVTAEDVEHATVTALSDEDVTEVQETHDDRVGTQVMSASLGLDPTGFTVEPEESATYDVVLETSSSSVGSFEATVELDDPAAGTLTDYTINANVSEDRTEIQDGEAVAFDVDLAESPPAANGNIVLGTVEVTGADVDNETTGIDVDEANVQNEDGDVYDIEQYTGGSFTVGTQSTSDLLLVRQGETDVFQGTHVTYDIVLDGAWTGINTKTLEFELSGSEAHFIEGSFNRSSATSDVTIGDDGQTLSMAVALLGNTYDPAETHRLGEFTVAGTEPGTVTVTTAEASVTDLDTAAYDIALAPGEFSVAEGLDVTGDGNPATSSTGGELLDDVSGSDDPTIVDVQALFDNLDNPVVQQNAERFDFAGIGGDVSIFDVQALFNRVR